MITKDDTGLDLPDGGFTTLTCNIVYVSIVDITDSLSVHIEDDIQNPLPRSSKHENGKY